MRYKILIVVIYISVVAGIASVWSNKKYKHSYRVTAIASSIVYLVLSSFIFSFLLREEVVKARSPFCGAPNLTGVKAVSI